MRSDENAGLRVDVCAADDHDGRDRLLAALRSAGAWAEDDRPLGVGLTRFAVGGEDVSVFVDAWVVDLAGPAAAVRRILDAMADLA